MTEQPVSCDVAVIGAGPAGLMAALSAAAEGASVLLLERNPEAGRKLLLTGSGRCNVTNARDIAEFIPAYFGNGRFLYPAFRRFSNTDTIAFFENHGVPLASEADGKLFPASGQAADVRNALMAACRAVGVAFRFGERVTGIVPVSGEPGGRRFRLPTDRNPAGHEAAAVVLTTGGLSYPATGSAGDGLRLAQRLGIAVVPTRPALAPMTCAESWIAGLAGVSVDPVRASLVLRGPDGNETPAGRAEGPLLFTHHGVSGPAVLRLSRDLPKPWPAGASYRILLDLLPHTNRDQLERRIADRLASSPRRGTANALEGILPASLLQAVIRSGGTDPAATAGTLPRSERRTIADRIKALPLTVAKSASYGEAMVTAGGIALDEIDPRSMGIKALPGLFAAGEVIDIDGDTGGYNLQAAFSTGALAGFHAAAGVRRPV